MIGNEEPKTLWHEFRMEGMVLFSTSPGLVSRPIPFAVAGRKGVSQYSYIPDT